MKTTAPAKATSKTTKSKTKSKSKTTKPATAKAKAPLAEPKSKTKAKTKAPVKPKAKKPTHTRPYLTGVVLKKHGLNSGVTPEMVKQLNKLYGVPNDRESAAQLKWAIHVLRGYVAAGKPAKK